jgi:arabinofuranosyltransferase
MQNKTASALGLTALVWAVALALRWYYHPALTGIDDANIYQVYMRHLAAGHGLVYNPGGERVEGFTSLLWTLVGSLYAWAGVPLEPALWCTAVVLVQLLLVRLAWTLPRLTAAPATAAFGATFSALYLVFVPGYFDWTIMSLMETALWSLALTGAALEASVPPDRASADARLAGWLVLLALTRPESMLWGVALLGVRLLGLAGEGGRPSAYWRRLRLPALAFLATVAGVVLWRRWYFGFPAPNTFYAKVSASLTDNLALGAHYLGSYFLHYNGMLPFMYATLAVWLLARLRRSNAAADRGLARAVALCLLNPVLPLLTGGDHFVWGRMLQPLLPLTYAVFGVIVYRAITAPGAAWRRPAMAWLSGALIVGAASLASDVFRWYHYPFRPTPLDREFELARLGRDLGAGLNGFFEKTQPAPAVGVVCAGGVALAYDGPVNDVLGLNNVDMAHAEAVKPPGRRKNHASFNKAVFLRQRPELFLPTEFVTDTAGYVPFEARPGFDDDFFAVSVDHVYRDSMFRVLYAPAFVARRDTQAVLFSYFRKDFLTRLDPRYYAVRPLR